MIEMTCPHCGNQLRIDDKYQGQAGACRKCNQIIQAPKFTVPSTPKTPPPIPPVKTTSPVNAPGATLNADEKPNANWRNAGILFFCYLGVLIVLIAFFGGDTSTPSAQPAPVRKPQQQTTPSAVPPEAQQADSEPSEEQSPDPFLRPPVKPIDPFEELQSKIVNGMTYSQVRDVIGWEGKKTGKIVIHGAEQVTYDWDGEEGFISAKFDNDRLTQATFKAYQAPPEPIAVSESDPADVYPDYLNAKVTREWNSLIVTNQDSFDWPNLDVYAKPEGKMFSHYSGHFGGVRAGTTVRIRISEITFGTIGDGFPLDKKFSSLQLNVMWDNGEESNWVHF
jgi:hypothetical protein